jgi:predicted lipoprotein with Yx(FWY)xxD motif
MKRHLQLAGCAVGVLLASACGSGASGNQKSPTPDASATASASDPTVNPAGPAGITTAQNSLGTILTDMHGRAVYLFEADKGPTSTCTGECAQAWPPLTTTGTPKASGGVTASLLGTTMRADGTREVTYAGHPLYTFAGDTQAGQTAGEGSNGFGALWWIVTPGGKALQH